MRIYPGELRSAQAWTECRYRIEFETAGLGSETLSFSVPDAYAGWISDRMEAPVMALLFLAMALGEAVTVEAPLSPQFHYGLRQIQAYFHLWFPGTLSVVDLQVAGYEEPSAPAEAVAACFSGGVDSFYTFWHHRLESEPVANHRVGYGVFVHGFDIPLEDLRFYEKTAAGYEATLATQSVSLVRCRTNIRALIESRVPWITFHGAAIQAVGLFLQRGLRRLIIPSTNRYSLLNPPIGSNPYTDPLASTERLTFLHHGGEASRIEKILAIADWPVVQQHLRVCFQPPGAFLNCGVCPKCQKVMAPLWLAGKLDAFTTFPPGFDLAAMPPSCFKGINLKRYAPERSYAEELCDLAATMSPAALARIPVPSSTPSPRRLRDRLLARWR
jgi:hypothetical protein